MIFVTGDTHIPIDISKLNTDNFPEQKNLSKNDYVIIAGDFGGVWNNSKEDSHWQKWLDKKPFTTLFVDGNHENFDLLNSHQVKEWNGGKVHFIKDNVIHLMRGQVFNVDSVKIFTFGGAESIDKLRRIEGKSWWKEEMPNHAEYEEGFDNLEKHKWQVDYIITHECSMKTFIEMNNYTFGLKSFYSEALRKYFDIIEEKVEFKHWYFGHYHDDINVDRKHTGLYQLIKKIF